MSFTLTANYGAFWLFLIQSGFQVLPNPAST